MSAATAWNFQTWAGTWQRHVKHTVACHTLEKRICRIPSQSTSRPILTSCLWCGTDASVDIIFKMLIVIQVTGWNLKHAAMLQVFSYKVQVNINLTQCTYKLLKHELSCQNRRCKIVDKGFPRTVSNGSLIPMYTWPKNGLKRFPKARTTWNYLKLFETIPNLIDITYHKPPERIETVLGISCSGIIFEPC